MKGLLINMYEQYIEKKFGEDLWDEILEKSHVQEETFIGPKSYDDKILPTLIETTASYLHLKPNDVMLMFGRHTFKGLASRANELVKKYQGPEDLLLELDKVIHKIEVKKLLSDGEPPEFNIQLHPDGHMTAEYSSKRGLCHYAEGILHGLADYYQRDIDCEQTQCVHLGGEKCVFELRFKPKVKNE